MHDLDRTLLEVADTENEEPGGLAMELDGDAAETGLDEAEEMALASEVLELNDDTEMEYFLGKLFSKVAKKVGGTLRSPLGQSLVGILKNAAKKALPMAGSALGTMVGGPLGTAIGGQLADQAGSVLGLELEGLSPQDQEFESARQFVRLAGSAARNALQNAFAGSPTETAAQAVASAARSYAPGLLRRAGLGGGTGAAAASGRWERHGNKIVLYGVF